MSPKHICILLLLLSISCEAWSIEKSIRQKYPNVLLTEDHDILNENDLAPYTWDIKPEPFSVKREAQYNYWQCFSREDVSLILEGMGYSSEEIGWKENHGDLKIVVGVGKGISHEYVMRRLGSISGCKEVFTRWQRLMKNEKYVCLAGRFSGRDIIIENNKEREVYSWIFEKIKTKRGCDSYFTGQCNRTYKQFLQDEENEKKWRLKS